MESCCIRKACFMKVPSESLKNLRGEVMGLPKIGKILFFKVNNSTYSIQAASWNIRKMGNKSATMYLKVWDYPYQAIEGGFVNNKGICPIALDSTKWLCLVHWRFSAWLTNPGPDVFSCIIYISIPIYDFAKLIFNFNF